MKKYVKWDLQLFAQPNTQVTTDNNMSVEMKTYYQDRLIDNAEPNLVYQQFGSKRPIPAGKGKSTEFRKYDPLPKNLTTLVEGVTPDGQSLNVTNITATVSQYGGYITVSDVLDLTAIDRNIDEATKLLGGQAGRTLDTVVRDIVTAGTNVMFAPSVSGTTETAITLRKDVTTACGLTPKVVRLAAAKLRRMNAVPIDDCFVAIVHPDVVCDLMGTEEWIDFHKHTDTGVGQYYNGEVGRIAGVRFVQSTEAKIFAPGKICGILACRTTAQANAASGATTVKPDITIAAADATAINAAITAGATYKVYIDGAEHTISGVTAGAPGTAAFTVDALTAAVTAGDVICGVGGGKDGTAVYGTMLLAANAYGVTEISGGGLKHIIKQMGSAGTADPLNQRATTGWKAMLTAVRLTEPYMVRIEHSGASFGATAEAN
jgi:N4-gp56 family major capsid protein